VKYVGKIFNFFTHRAVLGSIFLVLQVFMIVSMVWHFNVNFVYFYIFSYLLGILVSLYIINGNTNPGYKIAWIMVILVFPVIGIFIYALFGGVQLSQREKKKMHEIYTHQKKNLFQDDVVKNELRYESLTAYNQAMYITKYSLSPICKNTETEYFKIGEEYYERLIKELKKAKRYIFMEFFIVSSGKMWDSILEVLKEKVKEGVEVRFMYDDLGCIMLLPSHYYKTLESYGIKACTFNRFVPILRSKFNNRDHRKIVIIDGYIAFTGGINLADEYINEISKYGHWKDNGIMLKGEAVWNMTIMFMSMWDFVRGSKYSYRNYRPLPSEFDNIRKGGKISILLKEDDELIAVKKTSGEDEIVIGANNGRMVRFIETEIRAMGRNTSGVKGMDLGEHFVVGSEVIKPEQLVLIVTENGYGKQSPIEEYRLTHRGSKGVKALNITDKNGMMVALKCVDKDAIEDNDIMIITDSGIIMRMPLSQISVLKRATQGVRLINLKDNQKVSTVALVEKEIEEETAIEEQEAEVTQ